MARDLLPRPLSRREIQSLLQSLSSAPPDALMATAMSLYGWCHPADVSAALCAAMPIPRCVHGNPWNSCSACPSVSRIAAPN